jgi:hypothetical protein
MTLCKLKYDPDPNCELNNIKIIKTISTIEYCRQHQYGVGHIKPPLKLNRKIENADIGKYITRGNVPRKAASDDDDDDDDGGGDDVDDDGDDYDYDDYYYFYEDVDDDDDDDDDVDDDVDNDNKVDDRTMVDLIRVDLLVWFLLMMLLCCLEIRRIKRKGRID